ncbi:IS110 family transposase, partial [Fusicatenibacter saccharivorans]|nr:IS110 family transposase [Fusicatenibacter saccharivorans]
MRNSWTPYKFTFGGTRMYNAVGIDVSKGKSTVAVLQPAGVIIRKP